MTAGCLVVHDFAYADLGFDGYQPPSILQVQGAQEVAVEMYTLTKSFSMAGWRVGFLVGNAEVVAALAKLKSYLDYGTFQPIQIASIVAMNEAPDYPDEVNEIYRGRRDALCDGLARIGWEISRPRGDDVRRGRRIPEPYGEMRSLDFAHDARAGGERRRHAPASASAPAVRGSSASPSSRTSSGSDRPSGASARRSSSDEPGTTRRLARPPARPAARRGCLRASSRFAQPRPWAPRARRPARTPPIAPAARPRGASR